jgi:hypothetical protein
MAGANGIKKIRLIFFRSNICRADLYAPPTNLFPRTARVLICYYDDCLVALHGFIKKTRATLAGDLALARKRKRELEL